MKLFSLLGDLLGYKNSGDWDTDGQIWMRGGRKGKEILKDRVNLFEEGPLLTPFW